MGCDESNKVALHLHLTWRRVHDSVSLFHKAAVVCKSCGVSGEYF